MSIRNIWGGIEHPKRVHFTTLLNKLKHLISLREKEKKFKKKHAHQIFAQGVIKASKTPT